MGQLDDKPESTQNCPQCGAVLPASVPPALCPRCLLKTGFAAPVSGPAGTVVLPPPPASSRGLPQPGEVLGHYTIIRLLGAGGMGAVYETEDRDNGRRVALKVLGHGLDSLEARERFFREGRLAASINHPNSVYIFGTEEIAGTPVISMELVNGGTLQERVAAGGPLPIGEAVDAVLHIVAGLDAAQRAGILHRDIKPSNCYLAEDGTVKIGDFGLSISTMVRTEPSLTATGAFLGTPAFCSPEQLRGEELSTRSDMYSVGATLFYLLTGRTPFEAKNVVALLATVLEQRAPSPRTFRREIPTGLAKTVLRCLEKQPAERFKNYGELNRALEPYASTAPTPATLGLRFVAGVLDSILLAGLGMCLMVVPGGLFEWLGGSSHHFLARTALTAGTVSVAVLYYTILEGLWGASAGKALCRLRVVGPDRNPPGILRALCRTMLTGVVPALPFWLVSTLSLKFSVEATGLTRILLALSSHVILASLFATVRRRNGFAAMHDLLTGTRVISRAVGNARPRLASEEPVPPPEFAGSAQIGPYQVLAAMGTSGPERWFLGYDLRLLRKVWLRQLPTGTAPVPPSFRNIGRPGRLRWLTGKRSPDENWDAFEAAAGAPLLEVARGPRPWSQVRFWLHDIAAEINTAEKDGTLPSLALDRVWITSDGRAKLLDFLPPGLASQGPSPSSNSPNDFLVRLAGATLTGTEALPVTEPGSWAVPLPLHARSFLDALPRMTGAEAITVALKPLLSRVSVVTRSRRAAILGAIVGVPVICCLFTFYGYTVLHQAQLRNPRLMELSQVLNQRDGLRVFTPRDGPTDRQFAIYVASHYANIITNEQSWQDSAALIWIRGGPRQFAERSMTLSPAPTPDEIAAAEDAVKKRVRPLTLDRVTNPSFLLLASATVMLCYVCLPALLAAVAFRSGLLQLIAGIVFVRKDGARAGRMRAFWRALVAWSPLLVGVAVFPFLSSALKAGPGRSWAFVISGAIICLPPLVSLLFPKRALADHLAGTWPVPR